MSARFGHFLLFLDLLMTVEAGMALRIQEWKLDGDPRWLVLPLQIMLAVEEVYLALAYKFLPDVQSATKAGCILFVDFMFSVVYLVLVAQAALEEKFEGESVVVLTALGVVALIGLVSRCVLIQRLGRQKHTNSSQLSEPDSVTSDSYLPDSQARSAFPVITATTVGFVLVIPSAAPNDLLSNNYWTDVFLILISLAVDILWAWSNNRQGILLECTGLCGVLAMFIAVVVLCSLDLQNESNSSLDVIMLATTVGGVGLCLLCFCGLFYGAIFVDNGYQLSCREPVEEEEMEARIDPFHSIQAGWS